MSACKCVGLAEVTQNGISKKKFVFFNYLWLFIAPLFLGCSEINSVTVQLQDKRLETLFQETLVKALSFETVKQDFLLSV